MTKAKAVETSDLQAKSIEPKKGRYRPGSRKGVGGRKPMAYDEAKALEICARLASGDSLNMVLKDKDLPGREVVMRWRLENPQFAERYRQARESLLDVYADQIISISDDGTTDYVMKTGRNGHEYMAVDQEHIQRSRLRVDSRKWLLSKLRPEEYGDKITAEVGGKVTVTHDITSLTEREKMRRFALFMTEDQAQPPLAGQAVELPGDDDKAAKAAAPIDKDNSP